MFRADPTKITPKNKRRKSNVDVTDDGEVDVRVACLSQSEIDTASVERLIFGLDVGQDQRGRVAIRPERGPLTEYVATGPLLGHPEIRVSRINAVIPKRQRKEMNICINQSENGNNAVKWNVLI